MLSALAADRARIAELDAQIQDLERSLAAFRHEKSVAQKRLDSYKFPVLTLPNEIISEIFVHFLPTYPSCPPLCGSLSPSRLTQICRRWREIALATPALWRAVSLSKGSFFLRGDPKHIWLARSGSLPLSIHMDEYADGNVDGGLDLLAAALLHHARVEYLKLRFINSSPDTIDGGMPLLHHLDLELDYDLQKALIIRDAPFLRSAVLDVIATTNVVLPWTQLTQLTLRAISVDHCVPILQKTTNLVHCELELFERVESDPLPDITLPNLESLCCNGWRDDRPMTDTLGIFIVPALRSLEVTEEFLQPSPIDALKSFVSKSGCKLHKVCINGERSVGKIAYRTTFPSIQLLFNGPYVSGEEDEQEADGES
ncbi:F-box domain-containing protein [Mycena venus]|uniref:F-box domain-containing protein n=1 Tax=Mycena venus TaxID=2733690 RepID=A0A8H6X7C7_9AGAR|nr:F-box domain-containing protein [Mycena venus]